MLNRVIRNVVINVVNLLVLHSVYSNTKSISDIKHESLQRRHLPFPGAKSGIIFSDEVSFPFETGEDLIQTNENVNALENTRAKALELPELHSIVFVSTTEYPILSIPKDKIRRENQLTPGVKSLMATLKEEDGHSNSDEIKKMYKKIAVDFQVLQNLLTKQNPQIYQTNSSNGVSSDGRKTNNTSNVLTIEDVDSRQGPLTRITLIRRHIVERRSDLDLPVMPPRQAGKQVKLRIQPNLPM